MQLMDSYLTDRQQSIQVETFISPPLHLGPRSVTQGSTLSCVLYIIFTLDLPLTFSKDSILVQKEEESSNPKSATYIDDNFVMVTANNGYTLQQSFDNAVDTDDKYMANNKLMLNRENTKLMVMTKNPSIWKDIRIPAEPMQQR